MTIQAVIRALRCHNILLTIWPHTISWTRKNFNAAMRDARQSTGKDGFWDNMSRLTATYTSFHAWWRAVTKSTIRDQTWRYIWENTPEFVPISARCVGKTSSLSGTLQNTKKRYVGPKKLLRVMWTPNQWELETESSRENTCKWNTSLTLLVWRMISKTK